MFHSTSSYLIHTLPFVFSVAAVDVEADAWLPHSMKG